MRISSQRRFIKDSAAFTRSNHVYSYGWGYVFFSDAKRFSAILSDDDHKSLIYVYLYSTNEQITMDQANIVYLIE